MPLDASAEREFSFFSFNRLVSLSLFLLRVEIHIRETTRRQTPHAHTIARPIRAINCKQRGSASRTRGRVSRSRRRDFHEFPSRPDANTYIIRRDDGLFAGANNTASRYISSEPAESKRAKKRASRSRAHVCVRVRGDPPTYRRFVLA